MARVVAVFCGSVSWEKLPWISLSEDAEAFRLIQINHRCTIEFSIGKKVA